MMKFIFVVHDDDYRLAEKIADRIKEAIETFKLAEQHGQYVVRIEIDPVSVESR